MGNFLVSFFMHCFQRWYSRTKNRTTCFRLHYTYIDFWWSEYGFYGPDRFYIDQQQVLSLVRSKSFWFHETQI